MNTSQEAEFVAFVEGSARRLLRTAVMLTGDRGHGEDLLQTAYERTARRWARLDGSPEAYTRVVLARLATDRWRNLTARVGEVFGDLPERGGRDLAADVVTRQALFEAIRRLSPRQRAVLVLRYYEDLTEAQTAHALGVSVGTVKTTASRALARLRDIGTDLSVPLQERP